MPPRSLIFELGNRDFICRSCRVALRKRAPASWPVRHSSSYRSTSQTNKSPIARRQVDLSFEHDAKRRKTLESLGLLNDKESLKVNYFEEGENGDIRRLHDREAFDRSLTDNNKDVADRLRQLEIQLGQAFDLFKELDDAGGKREATQLWKQFSNETGQDTHDADDRYQKRTDVLIPINDAKNDARRHLKRLNRLLQMAAEQFDRGAAYSETMTLLWKAYLGARSALSRAWKDVPPQAWEVLWRAVADNADNDSNRMSHIYTLTKDMHLAGFPLTDDKQILAIEAMYVDGWEKEALDNHKRLVSTLGTRPETFVEYWQLGLRMHCLSGDLVRAQQVLEKILESPLEKDPRLLFPYIRACAQHPAYVDAGYKSYRQLRSLLGSSMTIDDYDQVVSSFLSTGQTEYALFVFVDMMTSGATDLQKGGKLPRNVANTFFFGKWLKRLIGAGDLDGAHDVLLFMQRKGITPAPIQVNGLVGAWLRSGTADNMQKAEELAWLMINSRIQFVQARQTMGVLKDAVHLRSSTGVWPRATLETISLLAENYNNRALHKKMEELWDATRDAEIKPDAFMMNHLLFSYLKAGRGRSVPDVYRTLADVHRLNPDQRTYLALWQALPVNRLFTLPRKEYENHVAEGRRLFAEMVPSASKIAKDGLEVSFARKVLHSFRKLEDRVGLLLAVRAFRHLFNFLPPDAMVFELVLGTADLARLTKTAEGKRSLLRQERRIEDFLQHRRSELIKAGELQKDDELSPTMKKEELCNFLELFLESECRERKQDAQDWELALEQAVREMRLYDGEPDRELTSEE
jgi:hypothetical protein